MSYHSRDDADGTLLQRSDGSVGSPTRRAAGSPTRLHRTSVPPPVPNRRVSHVSISSTTDIKQDPDDQAGDENLKILPRDKKLIAITFSLVNFCLGAFYSLLGPFFPTEVSWFCNFSPFTYFFMSFAHSHKILSLECTYINLYSYNHYLIRVFPSCNI
jgi:hypothetical protein